MLVCEIYTSIQGEGSTSGAPSVFLRLSGCNLHCWFCDIPESWFFEGTNLEHRRGIKYDQSKESTDLIPENIAGMINLSSDEYSGGIRNIIITGGEPLIHQKNPEFVQTLEKLKEELWTIEIETNGTIIPSNEVDQYIDKYNVSPKLENSNNSLGLRKKPKAYEWFIKKWESGKKVDFKFVVSNLIDMDEISNLVDEFNIPYEIVWLMPECTTKEELDEKAPWVIRECLNTGFNFCNRLQIQVWGNERKR